MMSNSPEGISGIDMVAEKWAFEYDTAIKRGFNIINQFKLREGNFDIMKQLFKSAFLKGQTSAGPFDFVGEMGNGVEAYWLGAEMERFPPPSIPAPGSIANIGVVSNVSNVSGNWSPGIPLPPTNNPNLIIDSFILNSILHLNTLSGTITTLSLYPAVPGAIISTGIINWTGYFVEP